MGGDRSDVISCSSKKLARALMKSLEEREGRVGAEGGRGFRSGGRRWRGEKSHPLFFLFAKNTASALVAGAPDNIKE